MKHLSCNIIAYPWNNFRKCVNKMWYKVTYSIVFISIGSYNHSIIRQVRKICYFDETHKLLVQRLNWPNFTHIFANQRFLNLCYKKQMIYIMPTLEQYYDSQYWNKITRRYHFSIAPTFVCQLPRHGQRWNSTRSVVNFSMGYLLVNNWKVFLSTWKYQTK